MEGSPLPAPSGTACEAPARRPRQVLPPTRPPDWPASDRARPGDPVPHIDGRARAQVGLIDSQPIAQDVDLTIAQRPVGRQPADLYHRCRAPGVPVFEGVHQPGHRRAVAGLGDADAQVPAHLPRLRDGGLPGGKQRVEGRAQPGLQRCSQRGQGDAAAGPLEQGTPDLPFKCGDHPAHLRLRHIDPLRRPPEAQLLAQHEERPYLIKVHRLALRAKPASSPG